MKKRILAAVLSAMIICSSIAAVPVISAEEITQEESAVQTVNRGTISVEQGKTVDLSGKITSGNNLVQWDSSDWSMADVSSGTVTGLKQGACTVTATIMDENYSTLRIEKFTIKITAPVVKATGIILSKTTYKLNAGQSFTLKATVSPSNATNKTVTWSTSDSTVAVVNSAGKVTAKKTGFSYVYAKADNVTKSCKLYVRLASPKSPKVSVVNASSLKIRWSKVAGAKGYAVYRSTVKNGTYYYVDSVTGCSFTDKSLKANTTYYYIIIAYNNNSNYESLNSVVCSGRTKLAKPAKVSKSSVKYNSAKISWSKVSGAKGYKVYRATSKKGTYKKIKTTTATSFINKKLKPNKKYYYKVRAYRVSNGKTYFGDYSSIKTVKTKFKTVMPSVVKNIFNESFNTASAKYGLDYSQGVFGHNAAGGYYLYPLSENKTKKYQKIKVQMYIWDYPGDDVHTVYVPVSIIFPGKTSITLSQLEHQFGSALETGYNSYDGYNWAEVKKFHGLSALFHLNSNNKCKTIIFYKPL